MLMSKKQELINFNILSSNFYNNDNWEISSNTKFYYNINNSIAFDTKTTTSCLNITLTNNILQNHYNSKLNSFFSMKMIISIGNIMMFFTGIITNILNLIILNRKSMKSTTNKYLTALALCDLFVLFFSQLILSNSFINDYSDSFSVSASNMDSFTQKVFENNSNFTVYSTSLSTNHQTNDLELSDSNNLLNTIIPEKKTSSIIKLYNKWSLSIYPRVYPYAYPLAIMFQIGTVLINLGMSTDRFIAIHFPLKSLKFCTISNAKKIIVLIFVFSLFYSLPRFFEYYVLTETYTINNETFEYVNYDLTSIGKSKIYRKIVYVWMYVLLQSVVPLCVLIIINMALIISLKESDKVLSRFAYNSTKAYRSSSIFNKIINNNTNNNIINSHLKSPIFNSNSNSRNKRFLNANNEGRKKDVTLMLIFVVVLFIILQSPAVICNFIYGFTQLAFKNDSDSVCYIGNFFIVTCSATNFFTYCIFNRRFRRELMLIIIKLICFKKYNKAKIIKRYSSIRGNSVGLASNNKFGRSNSKLTNKNTNIYNITPNSKKTYICQDIQYTVKERKYLIHKTFNNSNCENENFEENKKNTSDSSNRSSFRSIIYQKENNSIIFEKNDDIFGKSKRSTKSHSKKTHFSRGFGYYFKSRNNKRINFFSANFCNGQDTHDSSTSIVYV